MNKSDKHILFCNCKGEQIPSEILSETKNYLDKLPFKVTTISDLCGLAALNSKDLSVILEQNTEYLIIGCFPRTLKLIFHQVSPVNTGKQDRNYINLTESSFPQIRDQIERFCSDSIGTTSHNELIETSGWPSWYPVIDYDRCTACGQCADFCLFGVYEKTREKVTVFNPQGCKNQCPACGRICPATAIIFPKYKNGGAIGGSDEIDEKAELQRQAQDIESLLGNDIYHALQRRKQKRQSIIREDSMKKAMLERDNALTEKKKE
jgi:NAD-dependent dihydropyrimidine dehydrogenase PreA subunit